MIGLITISMFAAMVLLSPFRPSWGLALLILFFALKLSLQGSINQFRAFPPLAN